MVARPGGSQGCARTAWILLSTSVKEINSAIGTVRDPRQHENKEKVIRRRIVFATGDFFSRTAIMRSVRQLSVLNYFIRRKLSPTHALSTTKPVDVIYDVEEKSSDTFNMSVGYSGAFGFTGAVGIDVQQFRVSGTPFRGAVAKY